MKIDSTIDKITLKLQTGKTPPSKEEQYFNGGLNWYTPSDLNKKLLGESKRTVTKLAYEDKKATIYPKGTVLLSCIGDIGKLGIIVDDTSSSNQQITGLIPDTSKVTSEYLYYLCLAYKKVFEAKATKVVIPMLNNKRLRKIKISYDNDKNEQIKIANLLTQVESLITKREESIDLLDELLKSTFLDMFGKSINNTQKHSIVNLSEVSNKITDGTHQSPKFQTSGIPFLLVSNIKNNEIDYITQKYISDEDYEKLSKRTPIEAGNILLTTVGSYGNPAIIKNTKKFAFQRHIAFIQPKHEIVNYYYLFAMLKSPIVKHQIEKKVKGVAQKTLNLKDLKNIQIWLPERSSQDKFATIIQQVEATKAQYHDSLDKLNELFDSLSQRAFRGELDLGKMDIVEQLTEGDKEDRQNKGNLEKAFSSREIT